MNVDKLEKLRHSASHLLAGAVKSLYPKTLLGIGPAIEDGFYYDFGNIKLNPDDLKKIENKMKQLAKANDKFKKITVTKKKAKALLKGQKYKLDLLKDIKGKISFYQSGSFIDLCSGPHVKSTKEIKAFKLLKVAGAYWKGDSSKPMLTRVYGTAFYKEKELDDHLKLMEEAKLRDHRKIGRDLDLFSFNELSPGSVFFHPNGALIYNTLINFIRQEYKKRNYKEVITPLLYEKTLWQTSGHWEKFREDMFLLKIDNKDYAIKPMNCPGHMLYYKTSIRSYRDLPLRIADFAVLHRNELKGVLAGITRLRKLSQDDAHIFLTKEQIESEIENILDFVECVFKKVFKFDYSVNLSTKPKNSLGDPKIWKIAEKSLEKVLKKRKIKYEVKKGEGAFYGPKIDLNVVDSLKREWQLATIQLDFIMPKRFKLTYEAKNGRKETPIVIHRAILGSFERFIAILLEHTAGRLPLWLSPTQVKLLTLTDRNIKFAKNVKEELEKYNIRVELDDRKETISRKVRDAQLIKINYIVTVGDKEEKNNTLAIRTLDNKVKFGVKIEDFVKEIIEKIENKDVR